MLIVPNVSLSMNPMLKQKIHVDLDRIAEYDMKLMGIDSGTLGMPQTEYEVGVTMASNQFTHILHHDLSQLGDSFRIKVNKEGIRLTSEGEATINDSVLFRQAEGLVARLWQ